jgi:hypothetical protein
MKLFFTMLVVLFFSKIAFCDEVVKFKVSTSATKCETPDNNTVSCDKTKYDEAVITATLTPNESDPNILDAITSVEYVFENFKYNFQIFINKSKDDNGKFVYAVQVYAILRLVDNEDVIADQFVGLALLPDLNLVGKIFWYPKSVKDGEDRYYQSTVGISGVNN